MYWKVSVLLKRVFTSRIDFSLNLVLLYTTVSKTVSIQLCLKFIKSVGSLRYDSCIFDIGCSNVSTKKEILSDGPSQPEIIGLSL